MSKSLVIVESPAKARTIRKYLGSSYSVKASLGHVKDLPKSKMGVSVDKDFRPEYRIIPGKRKILAELIKSAKSSDQVFLALDPDREGEAIAWHIYEELGTEDGKIHRVLFNGITRKGIAEGLEHPHPINVKRFESQQARRILDRLVGYEISPILWKKVRRGLSAGRVQSVALRLVVDREKNTALVEGFNLVKRHMKRSQDNPQGKIVEREAPVAVSNLMLYCSSCKRGVKSVRRTEGDQVRRACKRCGNTLDA